MVYSSIRSARTSLGFSRLALTHDPQTPLVSRPNLRLPFIYVAFVIAAYKIENFYVPQAFLPTFIMHPPRTPPFRHALQSADTLKIVPTATNLQEHDRQVSFGSNETTPTTVLVADPAAVQDFVQHTSFIETPLEFGLGSLPYYELNFYHGDTLLETLYIEGTGIEYLSWANKAWSYSELTPESSQYLEQWLTTRGVNVATYSTSQSL